MGNRNCPSYFVVLVVRFVADFALLRVGRVMVNKLKYDDVLAATCEAFYLPSGDMVTGKLRRQDAIRGRHAFAMLAREFLDGATMASIAAYLGGRDHTTIISSIRRANALFDHDAEFRHRIINARRILTGGVADG